AYDGLFNVSSDHEVVAPTSPVTTVADEVIWAGRLGSTAIPAGGSLTVRSGGVIVYGTISGGTLSFRDNGSAVGALPFVSAGNTGTITSPIDAAAGLTKFGTGTLVISNNANAISGGININDGTLKIGGGQPMSLGSNDLYVSFNGNLDVNSN